MRKPQLYALLWDIVTILLILIAGTIVATQLRRDITFGAPLGSQYVSQPLLLYVILAICAVAAAFVHQSIFPRPTKRSRFFAVLGAIAVVFLLVAVLLPEISLLQLLYFVAAAILTSLIALWWTPTKQPLSIGLAQLWRSRALLSLWVRYNVLSRYSQTALGVLWIVALPLATSIILAFVFSYVMHTTDVGINAFVPFLLTGLTFWNLFMQGVQTGTIAIRMKLDLINQIYFPREILVIVKLGETMVDLLFTFLTTLVVNALFGILPNANYIFLPYILVIQVAFTLGVMFYASYLCVFVRDFAPLITVALQMLFYLTPIIYPLTIFPSFVGKLVGLLNPIAPLIGAYRAIMVNNQPPDFVSLSTVTVISGVVLYTGYMLFKAKEGRLTDFK
ncbi:MAG: ABC transporter permease [Chloroflexota bacterium]